LGAFALNFGSFSLRFWELFYWIGVGQLNQPGTVQKHSTEYLYSKFFDAKKVTRPKIDAKKVTPYRDRMKA